MKKVILFSIFFLFLFGCSEQETNPVAEPENSPMLRGGNSASSGCDYLVTATVNSSGSEWTYFITRTKPSAKDLSHFTIDLNNCGSESASFSNILSATVNGSPANLTASEGSGTGCNPLEVTNNFVKFDNLQSASSWVLVINYNRGYSVGNVAGWIKAGNSCNQVVIPGPTCPTDNPANKLISE
ncbi:MAG TPA: hypothetical protein VGB43_03375 [Flavobacterium sp.]|jgi:hypothetical protein